MYLPNPDKPEKCLKFEVPKVNPASAGMLEVKGCFAPYFSAFSSASERTASG